MCGTRTITAGAWLLIGLVLAFLLAIWQLGPILTPFALGLVFAYILNPLVDRLQRHGCARAPAATLVVTLTCLVLVALLLILVPLFVRQVGQLLQRLPAYIAWLQQQGLPWLSGLIGVELHLDLETIKNLLVTHWASAKDTLVLALEYMASGSVAIVNFGAIVLLTPLIVFYLLLDWHALKARVHTLTPHAWRATSGRLLAEADAVLSEFLRGQLSVMLVLAAYYSAGLWLAGLHYALPVGIITGLFVFVPYVGFGFGLFLALAAAALQMQGWQPIIGVAVVFSLGQVIESFILTPYLVGERIGLHPLAVIFSLMAFGQLFGFTGVLVALPASAALLVGIRELYARYIDSDLYRGRDAP